MNAECCPAAHLPHDDRPGACARALIVLCERVAVRNDTERQERTRDDREVAA